MYGTRGQYETSREPMHLLRTWSKQDKCVLALDLGTSMTNLAIMVLPGSQNIPEPMELARPDVHIKVLRDFGNTSIDENNLPTGNCPSEVWSADENLDASNAKNLWGWDARNASIHNERDADTQTYFENFKSDLDPEVWKDLSSSARQRTEAQISYFLFGLMKHAKKYYAEPGSDHQVCVSTLAGIVLTVPCCWDQKAIDILTDIVYRALRLTDFLPPEHPVLRVRPLIVDEASAVAECFLARNPHISNDPNVSLTAIDAGGGTCDCVNLEKVASRTSGGTVFVSGAETRLKRGINVGSQSLSRAVEEVIFRDLTKDPRWDETSARNTAKHQVKVYFEDQKNQILVAKPFRWNAGGRPPTRGMLTVQEKQKIAGEVFDPIVQFCRDRLDEVPTDTWDNAEKQHYLVRSGGFFKNTALRRLSYEDISQRYPRVKIETLIATSDMVTVGALIRVANTLRSAAKSRRAARFRFSIGYICQWPFTHPWRASKNEEFIPTSLRSDRSRTTKAADGDGFYLNDVIKYLWKQEQLYISPHLGADFYQLGDEQNSSAKVFVQLQFLLKDCVEKGFVRAMARGKLTDVPDSKKLYAYWSLSEEERRRRPRMEKVSYWQVKFKMTVETDGVSIRATASPERSAGSLMASEIANLSAQVCTREPIQALMEEVD